MSSLRAAYEEVPYPSYSRRASAPDRLAAIAILFGLSPQNPVTARVLELGCSEGGNLVPLALVNPEARFLGVDFARPAVARGEQRIRDLQLTNIELRTLDVRDFPADAGPFDYIIVHGVLSWVPAEIRAAIMALIGRHLAPNGVAYVDYNAQPGSGLRMLFRDATRFHVQRFSKPQQRIDQARSLIKLIIEANPAGSLYRTAAEEVLRRLMRTPDGALFHEDLAEVNEGFYFRDFIAAAASHDLQFLAEADLWEMNDAFLPPGVRERLAGLGTLVEREQYLDILRNRSFRQTLLCRAGGKIQRTLNGSTLSALWFSSDAEAALETRVESATFRGPLGTVTTHNPLVRAAIETLRQVFPRRRTLVELLDDVRQRQGAEQTDLDAALRGILLQLILSGLVQIHAGPSACVTEIPERPIASPLARQQFAHGESISSLDHQTVTIASEAGRQILPLLDGTKTVVQIGKLTNLPVSTVLEELRGMATRALLAPALF